MKKNIYSTGFILYASLAVATSIAAPRQISTREPFLSLPRNDGAQQSNVPDSGQQLPLPSPPHRGSHPPDNNRRPVHPQPPRNDGAQPVTRKSAPSEFRS